MDLIERLFHISPDGGSGSTEAMYVLALLTIMLVMVFRSIRGIRRRRGFKTD